MRPVARKPVSLRGKILGGDKPLLCAPVLSVDESHLNNEIKVVVSMEPDAIEWRADMFDGVEDMCRVKNMLGELREKAGRIPLIFTCRSHMEGGFRKIEERVRIQLIKEAMETGSVDVVDMELSAGKENIDYIRSYAEENDVALILSYHNFDETPPAEFLVEKMVDQVSMGADIAKVAVMPKTQEDVLSLLGATLEARRRIPNPVITAAMGGLGAVTRAAGWLFGSDLTFAAGVNASAEGQMPVEELRALMDMLEKARRCRWTD